MAMRQLSEINSDIKAVDEQINLLKEQRSTLNKELSERIFADFCETCGIVRGDVVHTRMNGDVMVCGIVSNFINLILVRKLKKNGEPYSSTMSLMPSDFEGCTIIGHIDENEKDNVQ